jgi:hypothetical protein
LYDIAQVFVPAHSSVKVDIYLLFGDSIHHTNLTYYCYKMWLKTSFVKFFILFFYFKKLLSPIKVTKKNCKIITSMLLIYYILVLIYYLNNNKNRETFMITLQFNWVLNLVKLTIAPRWQYVLNHFLSVKRIELWVKLFFLITKHGLYGTHDKKKYIYIYIYTLKIMK